MPGRPKGPHRVLRCILCDEAYGVSDVELGVYHPRTLICRGCYDGMLKDPSTCFGKRFDKRDSACDRHCPDRQLCEVICHRKARTISSVNI